MSKKKNVLANIITSLVMGVILGALLVVLASVLDVFFLIKWGLIIVGIIIILSNIPSLINGIVNINKKEGIVDVILSALGMLLGCGMIFKQDTVITVIVAAYLIIFPVVRIALSGKNGWRDQVKKEWIKMLIGVLLLMFLPALLSTANTVVKLIILISGWGVIGLSVIFFALSMTSYIIANKKSAADAPIETTADDVSDNQ